MSRSAAIEYFTGAYPIVVSMLQDDILEAINSQRSPDEQLSWAEYEMMLAAEKLQMAGAHQLEKESKIKTDHKTLASAKAIEAAIITRMLELSRRRWHAPVRQSQGDPDVTRMAESMPVPPTFMNHMRPEAA